MDSVKFKNVSTNKEEVVSLKLPHPREPGRKVKYVVAPGEIITLPVKFAYIVPHYRLTKVLQPVGWKWEELVQEEIGLTMKEYEMYFGSKPESEDTDVIKGTKVKE